MITSSLRLEKTRRPLEISLRQLSFCGGPICLTLALQSQAMPAVCSPALWRPGRVQICRLDGGFRSGARTRLRWWWWVESVVDVGLSDGGRSYAGGWTVVVSGCGLRGSAAGSCGVVEWYGGILPHSSPGVDDFVNTLID